MTDLILYEKLREEAKVCAKCALCTARTEVVFDRGNPDARLMFVGEAPGESEDLSGQAFVGRAGEELDKLIAAAGIKPDAFLIVNVLKCRPPGNRDPQPDEIASCRPASSFAYRPSLAPSMVMGVPKVAPPSVERAKRCVLKSCQAT